MIQYNSRPAFAKSYGRRGRVAQLVEQSLHKAKVAGSCPAPATSVVNRENVWVVGGIMSRFAIHRPHQGGMKSWGYYAPSAHQPHRDGTKKPTGWWVFEFDVPGCGARS